jgi:hypothetical protein
MAYGTKKPMSKMGRPVRNLEKMPMVTEDTPGEMAPAITRTPMTKPGASSSSGNLAKMPMVTNDIPGETTPSPTVIRTPMTKSPLRSGAINPKLTGMRSRDVNAKKSALRRMRGNK